MLSLAIFAVNMLHHRRDNVVDAVRPKVSFQSQSRGGSTVKSRQLLLLSKAAPGSAWDEALAVGRKISVTVAMSSSLWVEAALMGNSCYFH